MIITIRCFTCGKVLAHLWNDYIKEVQEEYEKKNINFSQKYIIKDLGEESIECKMLNKYGLNKYCCRRIMLSHVDLCDKL